MVIAFMADTFDKVLEIKPILALQQQMKIMSLSRMIFGKNDHTDEENRFLYILEAQNDDEDGDSAAYEIDSDQWRGRIHKIQQHIENSIKNLKKDQDQKLNGMNDKIDGFKGEMKGQ